MVGSSGKNNLFIVGEDGSALLIESRGTHTVALPSRAAVAELARAASRMPERASTASYLAVGARQATRRHKRARELNSGGW